MLKRLRNHWKVTNRELFLILMTFAITGSLTAWLSKKVVEWMEMEMHSLSYWSTKIFILLFGYQVIILIVGFALGMFSFFWNYEKKILTRLGFMKKSVIGNNHPETNPDFRLAIFASGAGSNAKNIINHFQNHPHIRVELVVCNRPQAGVVDIARQAGIDLLLIDKKEFNEHGYLEEFKKRGITHLILAGFLLKIPEILISHFPDKIFNLHPSLLPAFGGKGMYGNAVHTAVLAAREIKSGITIHMVNAEYDRGAIIAQFSCPIDEFDTCDSLSKKIQKLEHLHFPKVIEETILKNADATLGIHR